MSFVQLFTRARAAFLYSRMLTMLQRDNFHLRLTRGVNVSVQRKVRDDSRQRGPRDSRGCTREASWSQSLQFSCIILATGARLADAVGKRRANVTRSGF